MEIKKVLETVFLKEWNTLALILEDDVVVSLWNNVYMTENECFEYINENMSGVVQTSNSFKDYKSRGVECGIPSDPLEPYLKLYEDLRAYALKNKWRHLF